MPEWDFGALAHYEPEDGSEWGDLEHDDWSAVEHESDENHFTR